MGPPHWLSGMVNFLILGLSKCVPYFSAFPVPSDGHTIDEKPVLKI